MGPGLGDPRLHLSAIHRKDLYPPTDLDEVIGARTLAEYDEHRGQRSHIQRNN